MKLDKQTQEELQELQILEQNLQNILLQQQAFQLELNETEFAIEEIAKSSDDVYKIVGNIMIKSKKDDLKKELDEKIKLLNLRLKSIEKQEHLLREKAEKLKQELEKKLK